MCTRVKKNVFLLFLVVRGNMKVWKRSYAFKGRAVGRFQFNTTSCMAVFVPVLNLEISSFALWLFFFLLHYLLHGHAQANAD